MDPIPYDENYYRYRLKVSSRLTCECGTLTLWLTAISRGNDVVLETGEAVIPVLERKNINEYLSDQDKGRLDLLDEKVAHLQSTKADNLVYDPETHNLQLASGGEPIGNNVAIVTQQITSS